MPILSGAINGDRYGGASDCALDDGFLNPHVSQPVSECRMARQPVQSGNLV
jgi:hypothetical protein